jgi:hypothetical protein
VKSSPARTTADRKTLASSAVVAARSTGSKRASMRPAWMREKSSRVLTSRPSRCALRSMTSSSSPGRSGGAQLGDRTGDEGQRGAELVTDVAEEVGLGPVQLGQRLGPPPLGLVAAGVGEGGGDLVGHQTEEAVVGVVPAPVRVEPDDEEAGDRAALLPRRGDRQRDRLHRGHLPGAGRQVGEALEVLHQDVLAGQEPGQRPHPVVVRRQYPGQCCRPRLDARRAAQPGTAVVVDQVDGAEGQVRGVAGELLAGGGEHVVLGAGGPERRREIAQRAHSALADDLLGGLGDHAEQAAVAAVVAGQGAVGEGVVRLLPVAAALQEEQQVLVPGGSTAVEHRRGARRDGVPDLRPHLGGGPAQRPEVLGLQRVVPVGVVVEEEQVRSPAGPHREARRQQDPDGVPQPGGPLLRRAERGLRPVHGGHRAADLTPAGEQRPVGVLVDHAVSSPALVGSAPSGAPSMRDLARSVTAPITRGW